MLLVSVCEHLDSFLTVSLCVRVCVSRYTMLLCCCSVGAQVKVAVSHLQFGLTVDIHKQVSEARKENLGSLVQLVVRFKVCL